MKPKNTKKYIDEIRRLESLIKRNSKDKRNEIRLQKIKTLEKIIDITQKVKSKKLSPQNYKISYKDLRKEFVNYKKQFRFKGWEDLWDWRQPFARGILSAFMRKGAFDDLLGFEFSQYIDIDSGKVDKSNYMSALEKLKENKEDVYKMLESVLNLEEAGFTFNDLLIILKDKKWKADLDDLWYYAESPYIDIDSFKSRLSDLVRKIKKDRSSI